MKNKEIKPCPFCGARAILLSNYNHSNGRNYFFITCDECGVETPRIYQKPDYAVECWNRRTDDDRT